MKQGIKTILIVISLLFFFFCLSGFMMMGSFSVLAPVEQKEHYQFVVNLYVSGIILSILLVLYLIFFVKTSK